MTPHLTFGLRCDYASKKRQVILGALSIAVCDLDDIGNRNQHAELS